MLAIEVIKWKFWNDSHKLKWNIIMCSLFTVIFNRQCECCESLKRCWSYQCKISWLLFIITEGALRRPMTHDNHPIKPNPISSVSHKASKSSKQIDLSQHQMTSDDLNWQKDRKTKRQRDKKNKKTERRKDRKTKRQKSLKDSIADELFLDHSEPYGMSHHKLLIYWSRWSLILKDL